MMSVSKEELRRCRKLAELGGGRGKKRVHVTEAVEYVRELAVEQRNYNEGQDCILGGKTSSDRGGEARCTCIQKTQEYEHFVRQHAVLEQTFNPALSSKDAATPAGHQLPHFMLACNYIDTSPPEPEDSCSSQIFARVFFLMARVSVSS